MDDTRHMEDEFYDDHNPSDNFLAYLPAVIKEHWLLILVPALLMAAIGTAAAFLLPARYESRAVLLVEAQQLPEDLTGTAPDEIIDQRIAKVRQQIVGRRDLIELMSKHDLYIKKRQSEALSVVVEDMREDITIEPVDAKMQRSGGRNASTIAFSLAFSYNDATKAQAVAQDLVTKLIQIDGIRKADQAANTVRFLTNQADGVKTEIAQLETQISGIKARNGGILSSVTTAMFPSSAGSYDAQIMALQRANSDLAAQRNITKTAADRDPVLQQAEQTLAALEARYSDSHPDVLLARERLKEAKKLAAKNAQNIPVDTIEMQIASNNAQIGALQAARSGDVARSSSALSAQSKAPVVMEQVAQLQQRLDAAYARDRELTNRLIQARAGEQMENEQKGDRLDVIDPPVIPDEPTSPNRPLLILGGLLAGLGTGFVLALAMELFTRPIRSPEALKSIANIPLLVTVPIIGAEQESGGFFERLRARFSFKRAKA
jgi:polysaccharide biosynthesis transport protein